MEYGDVSNVRNWSDCEVLGAFRDEVTGEFPDFPTSIDVELSEDFVSFGLINGETGVVITRSGDTAKRFAWKQRMVSSRTTNQAVDIAFNLFEINDATDKLRGIYETDDGDLGEKLGQGVDVRLAFVFEDANKGLYERWITPEYGTVTINGDETVTEADPSEFNFTAAIFTDTAGDWRRIQRTEEGGS